MRSTGSSVSALTKCVAPISSAFCSLKGTLSTAMIFDAAARTAPWMTFRPTPPQPYTATVLPGSTFARLTTEPTPVTTAQPIRHTCSSGASPRILTTLSAGTTVRSEKVATIE